MSTHRPARTEAPILFSGPLVPKVIDGSKSMTRRLAGLATVNEHPDAWTFDRWQDGYPDGRRRAVFTSEDGEPVGIVCPYDAPKLWVKETMLQAGEWTRKSPEDDEFKLWSGRPLFHYCADGEPPVNVLPWGCLWRKWVSIHMRREWSRITIPTTTIRVERLHAITDHEAIREGVAELPLQEGQPGAWWTGNVAAGAELHARSPVEAFRLLWCSINGPESWKANPWVWVVAWHPPTVEVRR